MYICVAYSLLLRLCFGFVCQFVYICVLFSALVFFIIFCIFVFLSLVVSL